MDDSSAPDAVCYSFGAFSFHTRNLTLFEGETPLHLEGKVRECLLALLERPGEVLTRDELLERVWGTTHKSDQSISTVINKLRKLIGDEAIVTVHGVGYRLGVKLVRRLDERPAAALTLKVGEAIAGRPHWKLREALPGGLHPDVWLTEHEKTAERRVFKFASDARGLSRLKREVTLTRIIATRPELADGFVRVLDWQFENPPFHVEMPWVGPDLLRCAEDGVLATWPREQRLEMVAALAEHLAGAHALGVLHKDLKPANLLVCDRDGRPTLVIGDFGSGRLLGADLAESVGITRLGFTQTDIVASVSQEGTAIYLAPEVLAGDLPTVQSDLYSLGVLLFQVLVGDLRRPLAEGWQDRIDDALLAEDIACAVHDDPDRRYRTADELAARLRDLEARRAARISAEARQREAEALRQQLERQRLRRPWQYAAAGLLTLGVAVSTAFAIRSERLRGVAEHALTRATEQTAIAQAVTDFMTEELFSLADPYATSETSKALLDALRRAVPRIEKYVAGRPAVHAGMEVSLSSLFSSLAEVDEALAHYRKALAITEDPTNKLDIKGFMLELLAQHDRPDEAAALAAELRQECDRLTMPWPFGAVLGLGSYHYFRGEVAQAIEVFEKPWPTREFPIGRWDKPQAAAAVSLAYAYNAAGRRADVEAVVEPLLLAVQEGRLGNEVYALMTQNLVGLQRMDAGRLDEARTLMQQAEALAIERLPPSNSLRLGLTQNLGLVAQRSDQFDEAARRFDRAIVERREHLGPTSIFTIVSALERIHTALLAGDPQAAQAAAAALDTLTADLPAKDQLRAVAGLARAQAELAAGADAAAFARLDRLDLDAVTVSIDRLMIPQRRDLLLAARARQRGDRAEAARIEAALLPAIEKAGGGRGHALYRLAQRQIAAGAIAEAGG